MRHWLIRNDVGTAYIGREIKFLAATMPNAFGGRPHGATVRCLPDGRWFDPAGQTWRDRRGRPARWPDLEQMARLRTTRVVLAAANLDHDPANNRLETCVVFVSAAT